MTLVLPSTPCQDSRDMLAGLCLSWATQLDKVALLSSPFPFGPHLPASHLIRRSLHLTPPLDAAEILMTLRQPPNR